MEKKKILCYGDSNTWGYDPYKYDWMKGIYGRYDSDSRWPIILNDLLGSDYVVIEDALNGRTTCFEDPTWEGRSAIKDFRYSVESNEPVDLTILMLGTNDIKDIYSADSWVIGWGLEQLVSWYMSYMPSQISKNAKLLIVAPPHLNPRHDGTYFPGFSQKSHEKSIELEDIYKMMAQKYNCAFWDSAEYVEPNEYDGIHLSKEGCTIFAEEIHKIVKTII